MRLSINNITKRYKNKIAVDDFSVTLENGVYGLLGANGAGKTTLMRIICDVLQADEGGIAVDGISIQQMGEDYRELLGYLPQKFGYYSAFTGRDFMMYMAALKGLTVFSAKERNEHLLKTVGLWDVANQKIKTYSGGMCQRLGIAQSLIGYPKILVLDEPTAGLDPKERIHFRNIISSVAADSIVLLSTHIVSDVEQVADKILLMKAGKLILNDDTGMIGSSIEGQVWEGTVSKEIANQMVANNCIICTYHPSAGEVYLRVVSKKKPFETALNVQPELDDVYLYYFNEERTYANIEI